MNSALPFSRARPCLLAWATAAGVCLQAAGAFAQDPLAVAPESYRIQFENEWVRVVRVRYAPHTTVAAHAHTGSAAAFVYLNDAGPVTFRHQGGDPDVIRPATTARAFRLNREMTEVHEVTNPNDTASEFLRIEFKTEPLGEDSLKGRFAPEPYGANDAFSRVQFENAQIRVTRQGCPAGASCAVSGTASPRLVVAFVRSQLDGRARAAIEASGTTWLGASEERHIRSLGGEPAECLIFELKTRPRTEQADPAKGQGEATATAMPVWSQEITVTAGRGTQRLGDTASRVVVLNAGDLRATSAVTMDDALRQVPGFSLFRRTGSRAANPTAQGASLRGIGPSGASRTLVLIDGLPLNDGFGGWVYWSRVPRVALDQIELLEGGASNLYGSGALAGVVQGLIRRDSGVSLELAAGSPREQQASLYAAGRRGTWSARFTGEAFQTDGYYLIDEGRGAADAKAASRHLTGTLRLERRADRGTLFVEGARFGESRDNGTALQVNDTDWGQLNGGANLRGGLSLRAFYGTQTYHLTFSSVAADRNSEALIRTQRVPSRDAGASAQWTFTSKRNAVSLGLDSRFVRGHSEEKGFVAGRATSFTNSGGYQATLGAFVTDRMAFGSRGVLTVGARVDRWALNTASSISTVLASGQTTVTPFEDRATTAFSPSASLLWRLNREFRLTAAGYRAFRAPTLNELYRSFRVGDTQTLANASLTSERLIGGEAGLDWERGPIHARIVGFRAEVRDPVANVTLRTTPALITRQRQNLGRTRSQGIEWEVAGSWPAFQLSAGYAFTDAKVTDFSAAPELEGNQLAQVPRHQWTAQGQAKVRGFNASVQARYGGEQFEDDLNSLTLRAYFVLDARLSRRIGKGVEAFVSAENLTDSRYPVGLTPIETLGAPRIIRLGLRLDHGHPISLSPPGK
jgi:outer membrane cobalamin receptor